MLVNSREGQYHLSNLAVLTSTAVQDEYEPRQVRLRGNFGRIPRLHGQKARDGSKPGPDPITD